MSLEEALAQNTSALDRNSRLMEEMLGRASKNTAASEKTASEKTDTKPSKADADADEKPKRGRKPAAKKEKAPTVAEMKEIGQAFLDVSDEEEYKDRRAALAAIAEYFDAERFTAIDSKDRILARQLIEVAKAGELDNDDVAAAVASLSDDDDASEKPSRSRDDDI